MVSSSFSTFSNVFGFVVAIISLLALLVNTCRSHLPSNKIKELEELMDGTEAFFDKAVEDGLLIEPDFVLQTENRLTFLRTMTRSLQCRVYSATTLRQDYLEFLNGTSKAIGGTCQSLKILKARVISSSEEGRRMLEQRNSVSRPSLVAVLPPSPHFPKRFLDPIHVPQYFQEGD